MTVALNVSDLNKYDMQIVQLIDKRQTSFIICSAKVGLPRVFVVVNQSEEGNNENEGIYFKVYYFCYHVVSGQVKK